MDNGANGARLTNPFVFFIEKLSSRIQKVISQVWLACVWEQCGLMELRNGTVANDLISIYVKFSAALLICGELSDTVEKEDNSD